MVLETAEQMASTCERGIDVFTCTINVLLAEYRHMHWHHNDVFHGKSMIIRSGFILHVLQQLKFVDTEWMWLTGFFAALVCVLLNM